ncbi:MAG: hypothetical protein MSIBF_03645 [Candidatus Altiarchaeales archaeon IMC4]|nr:MAG: hypothetical protein MSIBF_03645 [Candidatus Altiarchaeales archaeon IMC4]
MAKGTPHLRRISNIPPSDRFTPAGMSMTGMGTVKLKLEELESMRLVDLAGMTQEAAAREVGVSRRTLWKDLKSARRKVADALCFGKTLEIRGGKYEVGG